MYLHPRRWPRPSGSAAFVVTNADMNNGLNGPIPRGKWLEARIVCKGPTIDALRSHAAMETDIGHADAEPRHEAGGRCHIGKPRHRWIQP